jgi:hypothetical protein
MGLYHSTYVAYGLEIPDTDFDTLDNTLADQPDGEHLYRVQHLFLGDFKKTFLLTRCEEIEACDFARLTPDAFTRTELPVWNTVLHNMAVRLGHEVHPEPAWLVLHDHS